MDEKHLASNFKVFFSYTLENMKIFQCNDNKKRREKFWNQIKRRANALNSSMYFITILKMVFTIAMKRAFTFNNASDADWALKKVYDETFRKKHIQLNPNQQLRKWCFKWFALGFDSVGWLEVPSFYFHAKCNDFSVLRGEHTRTDTRKSHMLALKEPIM